MLVSPLFARKSVKLFPATTDSVAQENRVADAEGLKRYESLRDVSADVERGVLIPLTTPVSPKLPRERRYALPETVAFVEKLDSDFYETTGHSLVIDSAVRPSGPTLAVPP
jgi:hypothetical protein